MIKQFIAFIIILFTGTTFAGETPASGGFGFESAEHINIGDQIKLKFDPFIDGKASVKLQLPNGLSLTYGEIIALGGDFYAYPDKPISQAKTDLDRKARFSSAFSLLAYDKNSVYEAPKILVVVQDEQKQLKDGLSKGEKTEDIYLRMETPHNILWNCITGGFCKEEFPKMSDEEFEKIYFLKAGRYLKIADTNFDHFGDAAIQTYKVGHALALEKAVKASTDNSLPELMEAYAINAFACHYLTDIFSSGHMRTPHYRLYRVVSPSSVGSVLAIYMHNEDGELGLYITNTHGDSWRAMGDRYYFDDRNQRNREIIKETMQTSADEIFSAYINRKIPAEDKALEKLPDLEKLNSDKTSRLNTSPMFYWNEEKESLMRRTNIDDPYTYEWTAYWAGWETLTELTNARGLPAEARRKV